MDGPPTAVEAALGAAAGDGRPRRRRRRVPRRGDRPTPGPTRGAAAASGSRTRTRRRDRCGPSSTTRRSHPAARDAGVAAVERTRRRCRRSAATARRWSSSCARRPAPTRPRSPASCATSASTGATCWATRSTTLLDRMLLALDVIARGGARAAPPVRRRRGRRRGVGGRGEAPTSRASTRSRSGSRATRRGCRGSCSSRRAPTSGSTSSRGATAREIRTLDAIPDEELDRLARWGITGLWLIGLWERSTARQRIKVWRGNPDAAASAYSLDDYVIAEDLGGEAAWANLRDRAWQRGIRLAADMVPNHMGIDSRWVIEHPEWFLRCPSRPIPATRSTARTVAERRPRRDPARGPLLGQQRRRRRVRAARPVDRASARYVYHGNDGTSFPWNDTAQLDFSQAAVREQVIQTILAVARRFPVIRFDAAMVLAKRHVRRLWFPAPGEGGGGDPVAGRVRVDDRRRVRRARCPTSSGARSSTGSRPRSRTRSSSPRRSGCSRATSSGRSGMHRVYNSAFMHMLRDEDNAGYRRVLKETLEFDPEILKRYVNFMNNPDEKTAVEQFGKGDKYIGVATLLATLPGLPMFGHGQFEGFAEKYGMEFRRATMQEHVDEWLIARHEREIVPLLHRRGRLRRGARLPAVRRRGRRRRRGRARVRVLERERAGAVARRLPQPVRGDVGLGQGLRGLRGEGGRRVASGSCGGRWPTAWASATGPRTTAGSCSASSAPGSSTCGRSPSSASAGCTSSSTRTRRSSSGRCASCTTRPACGGGWPSGSAAAASPRSRARSASSSCRRSTTRCGPSSRTRRGRRSSGSSPPSPMRPGRPTGARSPRPSTRSPSGQRSRCRSWTRSRTRRRRPRSGVWALLVAAGHRWPRAPRSDRRAGPGSRSCGWRGVVADALRARGLDEAAAWSAAERVHLLVDLPLASEVDGPADGRAARLVEAWLEHPVVRGFLRVNAWDGVEWFNRESWDELVAWADRMERVLTPADERAVRPVERSIVARALTEAGEASGYRVDGLRAALAGEGATPGPSSTPRLPKATGLPKGPLDRAKPAATARAPPAAPTRSRRGRRSLAAAGIRAALPAEQTSGLDRRARACQVRSGRGASTGRCRPSERLPERRSTRGHRSAAWRQPRASGTTACRPLATVLHHRRCPPVARSPADVLLARRPASPRPRRVPRLPRRRDVRRVPHPREEDRTVIAALLGLASRAATR